MSHVTSALTPRALGLSPLMLPSSFLGTDPRVLIRKEWARGTVHPDSMEHRQDGARLEEMLRLGASQLQSPPLWKAGAAPADVGQGGLLLPAPHLPLSRGKGGQWYGMAVEGGWGDPPGDFPNADLHAEGGNGGPLPSCPSRLEHRIP